MSTFSSDGGFLFSVDAVTDGPGFTVSTVAGSADDKRTGDTAMILCADADSDGSFLSSVSVSFSLVSANKGFGDDKVLSRLFSDDGPSDDVFDCLNSFRDLTAAASASDADADEKQFLLCSDAGSQVSSSDVSFVVDDCTSSSI